MCARAQYRNLGDSDTSPPFFFLMPLWKAQTRVLSSACFVILWAFSLPNHSSTNVMVLLPVEKWINKVHELCTKINSLITQGQCSSQETEPVKMFINNKTRLLIKLSQFVSSPCSAPNPALFQGISGFNVFHPAPASPNCSLQRSVCHHNFG